MRGLGPCGAAREPKTLTPGGLVDGDQREGGRRVDGSDHAGVRSSRMGMTSPAAARLLPCYAIVRRGQAEIFRTLKADLEEQDVVEVIWDRRVNDRRRSHESPPSERRRTERRGAAPEMWFTFGFLVAPQVARPRGD